MCSVRWRSILASSWSQNRMLVSGAERRMVGLSILDLGDDLRWKAAETAGLSGEVRRGRRDRDCRLPACGGGSCPEIAAAHA